MEQSHLSLKVRLIKIHIYIYIFKYLLYCSDFLTGYKCLQLFHMILNDAPSTSRFLSYTVHCLHNMTTSEVLLDSISVTMGTIQSLSDHPKLHDLFVNKLKLSFEVITLLLNQAKVISDCGFWF